MSKLTAYRKFSTAVKKANGQPIIRVGGGSPLYIVAEKELGSLTEIAVLAPYSEKMHSSAIVGHVTVAHLNRLGNANWATPHPDHKGREPVFDMKWLVT